MSDRNPAFDAWCYLAESPLKMDGRPLPLLTELIYRVCDNDAAKFERALEMLQAAFEAGQASAVVDALV